MNKWSFLPLRMVYNSAKLILTLAILLFWYNNAEAQLSIASTGTNYTIDFDNTVANVNNGTFNGSGLAPTPAVGELDSDAWRITGMSDGNSTFGGTHTGGDFARGSSTGGVSTGGTYGFDVGSGDFALGVQPGGSDFTPGTITLAITNNTGAAITDLDISYSIWVLNNADRSNSFNFSHSGDDVSYTSEATLDYTSTAGLDALGWVEVTRSISLTGLSIANGATYYLQWSSADVGGSGSRDEFALDDVVINAPSGAPCADPTPSTQAINIDTSSTGVGTINLTWTNGDGSNRIVIMNTSNSFTNPTDGTSPAADANWNNSGEQVVYNGSGNSVTITGVSATTTYWFRVYEYNCTGTETKFNTSTGTNNPNSFTTPAGPNYCGEEDFTNSNASPSYTDNSFVGNNSVTWTYTESRDGNGDANGSGINLPALMLRNTTSSLTSSSVSGGIGDFSCKLYKGFTGAGTRQVELYVNGVLYGTSTGFDDFSEHIFTVSGINISGGITIEIRNATGNQIIIDDIQWTCFACTDPAPTTQATNLDSTSATLNSITLSWTSGDGANRIVIMNSSSTITDPVDGTDPTADASWNNGGQQVVYNGTGNSVTVTGLTPGTQYWFEVFEFNCNGSDSKFATTSGTNANDFVIPSCYAPATQATNIDTTAGSTSSLDLTWTTGNGERRIVIMNTSNSFTDPTDGTSPSADASWNNAGEQVIYNGSGNSVTVTNLTAGTTYWFRVYEYNCTGSNSIFITSTAANNPNSIVTPLVSAPVLLSSGDIAITGFNGDLSPQNFSFVLLRDITTGTEVSFTDYGWEAATSSFYTAVTAGTEGDITWTADADYPCGTEVVIYDDNTATAGTVTGTPLKLEFRIGGPNLGNGDQITAYRGSFASPFLLYAVDWSTNKGDWDEATDEFTTAIPDFLSDGVTALALKKVDNGQFDCSNLTGVVGTIGIISTISTKGNWNSDKAITYDLVNTTCSYACDVAPTQLIATVVSAICTETGSEFGVQVCAADATGNVSESYAETIMLTQNYGSGTVSGTLTRSAVSGCVTFSGLSADAADDYAFSATDGSLSGQSDTITVSTSCLTEGIIINEVTNGTSGSQEYYELIVAGECGTTLDIRGMMIDDNNGDFTDDWSLASGIAPGHVRLANVASWSAVPVGSIILIYNADDKNSQIIADGIADDPNDANNDSIYVLPHNIGTSYLELTTDLPKYAGGYVAANTLYSPVTYDALLTGWGPLSIRNAGDALQTRGTTGEYFHGIAYGDNMTGGPDDLLLSTTSGGGMLYAFTKDDFRDAAQWNVLTASGNETPAAPNNADNLAWMLSIADPTGESCPFSVVSLDQIRLKLEISRKNEKPQLSWKSNLILTDGNFIIEKSSDGKNFKKLFHLKAMSNKLHQLVDYSAENGQTYYYRVTYTDENMNEFQSNVASINMAGLYISSLFPNPSRDYVHLSIVNANPNNSNITLTVKDMLGKSVINMDRNVEGEASFDLDVSKVESGTYIIEIKGESVLTWKRFNVIH